MFSYDVQIDGVPSQPILVFYLETIPQPRKNRVCQIGFRKLSYESNHITVKGG